MLYIRARVGAVPEIGVGEAMSDFPPEMVGDIGGPFFPLATLFLDAVLQREKVVSAKR